jgi:site-specific DNA recombinase
VARRKAGHKERSIAHDLGITQPAVQYAAALQRLMDQLGITDPYVPVTEAPTEGKLCRHKHKRYRFDPLPGAGEL